MPTHYIAALDIGSYWTRLGVQEYDDLRKPVGNFRVFQAYSHDIEGGVLNNPLTTMETIKQLIQMAQSMLQQPITQVVAVATVGPIEALPSEIKRGCLQRNGDDTIVARNDVEEMQRESRKIRADQLTDAQGKRRALLHTIPLGFLTDANATILRPQEQVIGAVSNNVTLCYLPFLAKERLTTRFRKCIQDAGLNLTQLYLEADALQRCQQSIQPEKGDVLLLNLGYSKTEFFATHNGEINHYSWDPRGLNYVVNTTCQKLELDPKSLSSGLINRIDLSKCNFNASHPADIFPQEAIQPNSLDDSFLWEFVYQYGTIALELKRHYASWFSNTNNPPRSFTVYLGGGLAALPKLDQLFKSFFTLLGKFPFQDVQTVGLPTAIDFYDLEKNLPHTITSQAALYGTIALAAKDQYYVKYQLPEPTTTQPQQPNTPQQPQKSSEHSVFNLPQNLISRAVRKVNSLLGTSAADDNQKN